LNQSDFWYHGAAATIEHLVRHFLALSHPISPCLPFICTCQFGRIFFSALARSLSAGYQCQDGKPIFLAVRALFYIAIFLF